MSTLFDQLKTSLKESPIGPAASEARAYARKLGRGLRGEISVALGRPVQAGEPLALQWKRIVRRSREAMHGLPPATGPRVLFVTGYGFSETKLAVESVLAMALRLQGASPMFLLCDKALSACEFNPYGNFEPPPGVHGPGLPPRQRLAKCRGCTRAIRDSFRPLDVPQVSLRAFSRVDDVPRLEGIVKDVPYDAYRDFVYKDIQVGEHAFSSVLRATLRGTLLDDAYTRWLFRRYLLSGMHLVDLAERMLAAERPERIVAIHGVYLIHGTMCEIGRKHEIPVVVWGIPYRRGTLLFSHRDTYHRTMVTEPASLWDRHPLTAQQEQRLDAYLASRWKGRDYVNYHPNPIEDRQRIRDELGLDAKRPIVSLYTNVIWDAQIYHTYNAYADMFTWLYATVEYFSRRPDLQLAIRVHPAEAKGKSLPKQPLVPEIAARFPSLPENVKVVPPESDISSYTLAEMSRATLVYGTKMGIEIAVRGIPVIVAGETFSRGKDFTYDVSSASEYFSLLDRVASLPRNSTEMVRRARRYAYYLFFERMIDFPLISVTDHLRSIGLCLKFRDTSELAPGRASNLDLICHAMLTGSSFVQDETGFADEGVLGR